MTTNLRKGFSLVELLVVIAVMAILMSIAFPAFGLITKKAESIRVSANVSQIVRSLVLFQTDKGTYPTDSEAFLNGFNVSTAPSSANEYFAQLMTEGIIDGGGEPLFYTKGSAICADAPEPDGIITNNGGDIDPNEILKPGECGLSYIANLSSRTPSSAPIVMDSTIDGNSGSDFDLELRGGKVIVGLLNQSVIEARIDRDSPSRITRGGTDTEPNLADFGNQQIYGQTGGNTPEFTSPDTL